ncbi:MAG: T9SS type A sorting domain-containing protein [Crocinitomicaceae bacterium]|nr:T9SS type A sorting domain-containing protein [Crocinitomicaceae bacterium]
MKRISTLFYFAFLAISIIPGISNAQCTFTVTAADSTLCQGDTTTLSVNYPGSSGLNTTFAGGNNHRGNMFDITAINTVTITQFEGHPMSNTTVEVYYKTGTYVGSENTAGAWTLLGSAAVIAQPMGTPTPYPVPVNVTIPAGQTYAFYVTSSNTAVSQNYTDGTSVGNVFASDANIQFKEGCGIEYPFSGGPFTPRIWNGVIHYAAPATFLWSTGESTQTIDVIPSANTTYYVDVTLFGCSMATDSVEIEVFSPNVNLGTDQTLCLDEVTTLDAGSGFDLYDWSTAETTQTIDIDASVLGAGTYDYGVTVTDTNGCSATDTLGITITSCAGLNDMKQLNDIMIYPNPVNENLSISIPLNLEKAITVTITDELGQIIYSDEISAGQNLVLVPMTTYATGIYLVKLESEDQVVWKKIVKN